MNDIAPSLASGPSQTALQGMHSTPAAPVTHAPNIDTQVRRGMGTLNGRLIAVGDGQTAQRMQDDTALRAMLASASPAIKAMLADVATGPGLHGILQLKERQLGNRGG